MGLGIGIFLKGLAPLTLYLTGLVLAVMAMSGRVRGALMLAAFLLPLRNIVDRIQMYPFGNQFIDILVIGVILGGLMNLKSPGLTSREKSGIHTIALIAVIYLLFSVIRGGFFLNYGFSFDTHDSRVQDWKNFSLMPLLFFLNFKNNNNKNDVWIMFAVMCCSMFLADYYTINQIREHVSALASRDSIRGTFQFLGPNEVAAFFNGNTLILMSVLYALKKGRNKWLLLIVILANLFCIMFLFSRGAYAGLIMGMFILFSFKDKKMLIPLFLVLMLWQTVLPQDVVDRIKETKTEAGKLDVSSQTRIDIWHQALEYFKSSPIVGIGFGSFRHLGLALGDTHNIYVKYLTEQGIIGIIILLFTFFCFIKEGWLLYQKGDDELSKALGLGFVCCVSTVMVNNCFGDRWSYLEPNAYLWIFAGLVARLNVIAREPQMGPATELQNSPKSSLPNPPHGGGGNSGQKPKKKIRYYDPPGQV
jgi:O-antigen ligase